MTELDYCVLGVIWREGPLTAYGVRRRFASSVTPAWSSSAGSIYPSIRRLVARGLVTTGVQRDERGGRDLEVTTRGVTALRAWLRTVMPSSNGPAMDPIRTRVQFLEVLRGQEVRKFVDAAIQDCRAVLRELQAERRRRERETKALEVWAVIGAIYEVEARFRWLTRLRRGILDRGAGRSPRSR